MRKGGFVVTDIIPKQGTVRSQNNKLTIKYKSIEYLYLIQWNDVKESPEGQVQTDYTIITVSCNAQGTTFCYKISHSYEIATFIK